MYYMVDLYIKMKFDFIKEEDRYMIFNFLYKLFGVVFLLVNLIRFSIIFYL